ncbi:unnamed protein product [Discosporangium mesarthrocarpum]
MWGSALPHRKTESPSYALWRPRDLRTEAIRRSGKRRPPFFGESDDDRLGNLSTAPTGAIADALQKRDEWSLRKGEEVEWVSTPPCTPQKKVARSSTQDSDGRPLFQLRSTRAAETRLLAILFSEEFFDELLCSENTATREELDRRQVGHRKSIRKEVAKAFLDPGWEAEPGTTLANPKLHGGSNPVVEELLSILDVLNYVSPGHRWKKVFAKEDGNLDVHSASMSMKLWWKEMLKYYSVRKISGTASNPFIPCFLGNICQRLPLL